MKPQLEYIIGEGPPKSCRYRWDRLIIFISSRRNFDKKSHTCFEIQNDIIEAARNGKFRDGHVIIHELE